MFDVDDGASLLMAFRGLRAEAASEGALHESVAKELQTAVAEPFEKWAEGYKVCSSVGGRAVMDMITERLMAP